jgi:hypothetical protein
VRGSRYHCTECVSGNFDVCENCVALGRQCLNSEHVLEKIPIFQFGDCVHVNKRSCKDCESIPTFPHEGEVTKFRVTRLENKENGGEYSSCLHYIAVSYCWPPPVFDENGSFVQHQGKYFVKGENGQTRPNRAPESVIDRAVKFAKMAFSSSG